MRIAKSRTTTTRQLVFPRRGGVKGEKKDDGTNEQLSSIMKSKYENAIKSRVK